MNELPTSTVLARRASTVTTDGEALVACCGYLHRQSRPCAWCGEPARTLARKALDAR